MQTLYLLFPFCFQYKFYKPLCCLLFSASLVIDDALCEKRLWDMKYKEVKNFYMCEIRKDFTIDATFKGNSSRFLNHSCDPNCVLEKWLVCFNITAYILLCNLGTVPTFRFRLDGFFFQYCFSSCNY